MQRGTTIRMSQALKTLMPLRSATGLNQLARFGCHAALPHCAQPKVILGLPLSEKPPETIEVDNQNVFYVIR